MTFPFKFFVRNEKKKKCELGLNYHRALKTGRQEVPGPNPGRACRPSSSEFSVVFSETRVNTG